MFKKIMLFVILFLVSSLGWAEDSYYLQSCLNTVSSDNQSYCYRQEARRLDYIECPHANRSYCIEQNQRRLVEIEEKKIEVLARLKSFEASNVKINTNLSSLNKNSNRSNSISSATLLKENKRRI